MTNLKSLTSALAYAILSHARLGVYAKDGLPLGTISMNPLGGVFCRRGTAKSVEQGASYSEGLHALSAGFWPSKYIAILLFVILVACNKAPVDNGPIRINQVGFAPGQEMTATIVLGNDPSITNYQSSITNYQSSITNCYITNIAGDTVWTGVTSEIMYNPVSGKPCRIVDFSALDTPGTYTLYVENHQSPITNHQLPITNVQFTIRQRPYKELTRKALRAFYYQRASMPIVEPFAEGFARPAGHPDDHVIVHASAATEDRPEGTIISCPGGWYDAGDYNKYIVNSGYTMGVWLMTYELNKAYFDTLNLNIPESQITNHPERLPDGTGRAASAEKGNHQSQITNHQSPITNNQSPLTPRVPDMLSEAMYNLRWMLTMQDLDGGVYHKLTEPDFEGFIRPDQCQKPRYVVLKTTAATLDFAATMAMAARVYAPYDPDFCATAKEAAEMAFAWALDHPDIYYDQDALNQKSKITNNQSPITNHQSSPMITTGAYDDFSVDDEFYWAATELYLLTGEKQYMQYAINYHPADYQPAVWGNVAELAALEWMVRSKNADALVDYLQPFIDEVEYSVFRSPYGNTESDFYWGCNSEGCCWRGIECLYAYRLTGDRKYLVNAERCLNYILGQNATGYCYVTGFGTHPSSHPHHRLSFSHPKGTHPGFLVGGPNPARQDAATDGVKYPKNIPADESYLDEQPSYASNEVTINWNVTLFALSAGIDALQ